MLKPRKVSTNPHYHPGKIDYFYGNQKSSVPHGEIHRVERISATLIKDFFMYLKTGHVDGVRGLLSAV
jgi:hypothetical protein